MLYCCTTYAAPYYYRFMQCGNFMRKTRVVYALPPPRLQGNVEMHSVTIMQSRHTSVYTDMHIKLR